MSAVSVFCHCVIGVWTGGFGLRQDQVFGNVGACGNATIGSDLRSHALIGDTIRRIFRCSGGRPRQTFREKRRTEHGPNSGLGFGFQEVKELASRRGRPPGAAARSVSG
jgi:hypothetical protein